jgi:pantoate--beta-alanine ligase
LLRKLKVDYLYLPSYLDIFSFKSRNKIYLHNFSKKLCGKYRRSHFKGVVNVVNRFLEIAKPKYILLGKKDFQQLFLIKKHIEKNKINTKVISCNTVREKNGIACSSRNKNLSKKEFKNLSKIIKLIKKNKNSINRKEIFKIMKKEGVKKIDYVEFLNLKTLKKSKNLKSKFNIFLSFYLGKTRLIDNF